jgi:hypothetical protein
MTTPAAPDVLETAPGERVLRLIALGAAVIILAVALLGFAVFLFWNLYLGTYERLWQPIFADHFLAIVGIPVSGVTAVAVVQFFRGLHGPIEIEIAGSRFRGATGPVILWIFCFLATVHGMNLLWRVT